MSATIPLSTKGRSLQHLAGRLNSAAVLPLALIDHAAWLADRAVAIEALLARPWVLGQALIVRSSAVTESAPGAASDAGRYLTIPRVHPDPDQLADAIDQVFTSYGTPRAGDEVLVQPELRDVRSAGVATTHDPTSGAPYTVLSWADRDTNTVTSGRPGTVRTWYGAAYTERGNRGPDPIPPVLALLAELREVTGESHLAVEWAVTADAALVLLQVRQLGLTTTRDVVSETDHSSLLARVDHAVRTARARRGLGELSAFGVMPDWNPAEIIGLRPRPLARSLYGLLITDAVWRIARSRLGYRDPGVPLLVDLGGLPYVDVRASMSSLVPRRVPTDVAVRLVETWIAHLLSAPHLHDKVESRVVVSSLGLRVPGRLEELTAIGVAQRDIGELHGALLPLTVAMVNGQAWEQNVSRVESLPHRVPAGADPAGLLARLRSCCDYGTKPFAALARCAFVATEFLDDLVAEEVLTLDQRAAYVRDLDLVSGQLTQDFHRLTQDELLSLYGHLRPGTWDIRAARYDENPARYFDWSLRTPRQDQEPSPAFSISGAQLSRIDRLLRRRGLPIQPQRLLDFIAATVRGRERAKYLFSGVLSDVLRDLRTLGEHHGFDAEQMSYTDVEVLRRLRADDYRDTTLLANAIDAGQNRYGAARWLELPPLLSAPEQVWAFEMPAVQPSYITRSRVRAEVARVDAGEPPDGAIVLIDSADPGYDWIFTRGIAGLITAWGGVNSHMAVRAIELGIPAAIGVGPDLFRRLWNATTLDLDAGARSVEEVS